MGPHGTDLQQENPEIPSWMVIYIKMILKKNTSDHQQLWLMHHGKNSWRGEKLHLFKQNSRILPVKLLIQCSPCSMFLFCSIGIDELKSGQAGYSLPGYGESKEWKGHEQILLWNMFKQLPGVKPSKWNHSKLISLRKWDGRGIWSCSEAKRCEAPEYQKPSQYQWFNGCP